jgi:hypothetical protein
MFERMNRRLEALQKQIDAEKQAKGQPNNGLTVPTAVEKHHAKQHERRPADFVDTQPGGVAPC